MVSPLYSLLIPLLYSNFIKQFHLTPASFEEFPFQKT